MLTPKEESDFIVSSKEMSQTYSSTHTIFVKSYVKMIKLLRKNCEASCREAHFFLVNFFLRFAGEELKLLGVNNLDEETKEKIMIWIQEGMRRH